MMETAHYSGTIKPAFVENPKYAVGDIVYNSLANEHYLIEGVLNGFLGTFYNFTVLETGRTSSDTCIRADKSKNLTKVA